MNSRRGRLAAIASAAVGIAVLVTAIYAFRAEIWREVPSRSIFDDPDLARTNSTSPLAQKRADILEGTIPVGDFIRFLSDYTGLVIIADPRIGERSITVVSEIRGVDPEIVLALLEAHGLVILKEDLADGRQVLLVKDRDSTSSF